MRLDQDKPTGMKRDETPACTLIERQVSIAILAIHEALSRARTGANAIRCGNKPRPLQLAWILDSGDVDGQRVLTAGVRGTATMVTSTFR